MIVQLTLIRVDSNIIDLTLNLRWKVLLGLVSAGLSVAFAWVLVSRFDMGIAGGWKGYYEVTPDHNALVGESASVGRFLYATGFSGHGFLQGPAVGEIVRDLVLEREPFVDVTALSAERFARAQARPERNVI